MQQVVLERPGGHRKACTWGRLDGVCANSQDDLQQSATTAVLGIPVVKLPSDDRPARVPNFEALIFSMRIHAETKPRKIHST